MSLEKIKIVHSRLTDRILLARFGKSAVMALEKRDAHMEAISAVMNHLLHGGKSASEIEVHSMDGNVYVLSVRKLRASEPADAPQPAAVPREHSDPHGVQACTHPDCGRFRDGAGWDCRADDDACARPSGPQPHSPAAGAAAVPRGHSQATQPAVVPSSGELALIERQLEQLASLGPRAAYAIGALSERVADLVDDAVPRERPDDPQTKLTPADDVAGGLIATLWADSGQTVPRDLAVRLAEALAVCFGAHTPAVGMKFSDRLQRAAAALDEARAAGLLEDKP